MLGGVFYARWMIVSFRPRVIGVLAVALTFASTQASAQELSAAKPEPAAPDTKKPDPFAFADFAWLTGNARTKDAPLDSKAFTGEFRVDTNYPCSFNHPQDDTIPVQARSSDPAKSSSRSLASAVTFTTRTCAAA
jgi:hypothetical protein